MVEYTWQICGDFFREGGFRILGMEGGVVEGHEIWAFRAWFVLNNSNNVVEL